MRNCRTPVPLVLPVGQGWQFDLEPLLRDILKCRRDLGGWRGVGCLIVRRLGLRMRSAGLRQRHARVAAIGPRALFAVLRIVARQLFSPVGATKRYRPPPSVSL